MLLNVGSFTRADRTLDAIDAAIEKDGGDLFRKLEQKWLPLITDAYEQKGDRVPFRHHLGVSTIGEPCARKLWYAYRWYGNPGSFPAKTLRLFNRGHLEEARFLAMMEMIGVIIQEPQAGQQFRIATHHGHFATAVDAIMFGVPDNPTVQMLGEFKTHNDKSFVSLIKDGVKRSKPTHWAQMQVCMALTGIPFCLYLAVNKNTDALHGEVIAYDAEGARPFINKALIIIASRAPPKRLYENPAMEACRWCPFKGECFDKQPSEHKTCRSCQFSVAVADKAWYCEKYQCLLPQELQERGCATYTPIASY